MTEYRKRFDDRLPQIESAIDSMAGSLDNFLPGLSKQRLKRFFQRFSILFGRLDKNGARQPQFLAFSGQSVADAIIGNIDAAIAQMGSGASTFANNNLFTLVDLQEKLERAVGLDSTTLNQVSLAAVKDLGAVVGQADELLEHSVTLSSKIEGLLATATAQQAALQQSQQTAKTDAEAVAAFRKKVSQLLNPDGAQANSLQMLVKRVQAKEEEINAFNERVSKATAETDALVQHTQAMAFEIDKALVSIAGSEEEAKRILGLSAQAGLARSYLTESEKLGWRSTVFTGLLYATAAATIALAACYVLPSLESAVKGNVTGQETKLLLTLLRASILAPLVFVLYFTNRQIRTIDMLRMDYAEKAAASLAYSGYRDEMSNDASLLERLRSSLLLKFAEHPERLLRKVLPNERIEINESGFKMQSETGESDAAREAG